ncbi:MAG: hypothetical protein N2321_05595 [Melioribacteraceae bacterium]|mgnify:CR=1 FL=1|nr:hypothetical protein [Melioribacteraceae bacterium]
MKNILFIILISITNLYSQNVDSLNYASNDSIDIKAIVQNQIEEAKKKKSFIYDESVNAQIKDEKLLNEKILSESRTNNANVSFVSNFYSNLPIQYKLFMVLSLVIILSIIIRRSFIQLKRKSIRNYKNKIALLREEKISGSVVNNKKRQIRIKLKDNPIALQQNEKEIALNAKQLNISKGELLLAARLKLLEVNKVQRSL